MKHNGIWLKGYNPQDSKTFHGRAISKECFHPLAISAESFSVWFRRYHIKALNSPISCCPPAMAETEPLHGFSQPTFDCIDEKEEVPRSKLRRMGKAVSLANSVIRREISSLSQQTPYSFLLVTRMRQEGMQCWVRGVVFIQASSTDSGEPRWCWAHDPVSAEKWTHAHMLRLPHHITSHLKGTWERNTAQRKLNVSAEVQHVLLAPIPTFAPWHYLVWIGRLLHSFSH